MWLLSFNHKELIQRKWYKKQVQPMERRLFSVCNSPIAPLLKIPATEAIYGTVFKYICGLGAFLSKHLGAAVKAGALS